MKIYIAAHEQDSARSLADKLSILGHIITSRWVYADFFGTEKYSIEDRHMIANEDASDVTDADCVVLIASPDKVPGGKFVEVGIAIGQGKIVYLIGRRENMLMWHKNVVQFDSVKEFLAAQP